MLSTQPFFLNGIEVDAKRGTLKLDSIKTSVEPKVMLVLLYLVANAEQVIEQEKLFDYVWPKSIFSANSLRRCISTLRKVFQDTDKSLISTHPKIGYSINAQPTFKNSAHERVNKKNITSVMSIVTACLLVMSLFIYLQNSQSTTLHIKEMQPLTATEKLEDFIALSPDDKAIAFTRYEANKISSSEVWLKDILTLKEHKLDIEEGHIRNINWTLDGQALIYLSVNNSGWAIQQAHLNHQQQVNKIITLLKDNTRSRVSSIHQDELGNLYYVSNSNGSNSLYRFDIKSQNLSKIEGTSKQFLPFELALSHDGKTLSVSGQNSDSLAIIKHYNIETLKVISIDKLKVKERFSLQWLSDERGMLLNNGRRLYVLPNEGSLSKIDFEHSQFIRFPTASSKAIYLISSSLDHDLIHFDLKSSQQQALINSNAMDYLPSIASNKSLISYYSTRYGKPQLFLYNNETKEDKLLFDNPNNHLNVDKAQWNKANNHIAFSLGYSIYTLSLEDKSQHLEYHDSLNGVVLDWFIDNQSLLIWQHQKIDKALIKYNIHTGKQTILANSTVKPFMDAQGQVYIFSAQQLFTLNPQGQMELKITFKEEIKSYIPHKKGIYITFKETPDKWRFWQFDDEKFIEERTVDLPQNVAAISEDGTFIIKTTEERQKDIIKLTID